MSSKTNISILNVSLIPFIFALSLSLARILVSVKPGEYAFRHFGYCCVSFERYPVVIIFFLVVIDWIFGARATQHSVYVATLFGLAMHASTERVLNVLAAFAVFRSLELPLGKFRLLDFAQKACVFMLFSLIALPDSNLTILLFSRPRFLIRE